MSDGFLLVKEVAGMLRVSDETVYRLCRRKQLKATRVGGLWRISREAVDDFLRKGEEQASMSSKLQPRYPRLVVDLSRANYSFGVESRVHGQMKAHGLPRRVRQEFTKEIQQVRTFEEQVAIARRWVTVKVVPAKREVLT